MKKDLTISPEASIKQAMEALDLTAEKVLLVVDKNKKLIGTLTDGDIRRYILTGNDLKGSIAKAHNTNSTFVYEKDFDIEEVKKSLMGKKIDLIPVVDADHIVVDYVTWEEAFRDGEKLLRQRKKLNIPVVIIAGGKGTRLEPFTKVLPKSLIPIGDKPIIELIIEKFREYGIDEYYMTINQMSKIIKAYFEEKSPDYFIGFAEEDEPLGTAGSLKLLKDKLNTSFFVTNCDVIINTDYSDLYEFHEINQYDITLVASVKDYNIPYGICEIENDGELATIREKPEFSFLVNTGLYVLNHSVLKLIPGNKVFHINDLIDAVKKEGGKIGVYPVSEKAWIDVGQWTEYKKALTTLDLD